MFCVYSYEHNRQCLSGEDFTVEYPFRVSRQVLGETLLDIDGPRHRRLRKLLARLLQGRLQNICFRDVIDDAVTTVIDDLDRGRRVEFVAEVAARVPLLVTAAFLGVPTRDCAFVQERLGYLLRHLDGSQGDFARASHLRRELDDYVADLLGSDRVRQDSMLAQLAELVTAETLTLPEAQSFTLLTLAAGVETSTGMLANTMVCLARDPHWLRTVVEVPAALGPVIREALRFEPPQHDTVRFAARDTTLGGVAIPRGAAVKVIIASGNRDEAVFARAATFDPDRSETAMLTFGHGLHSCLGTHVATAVAEAFFAAFFTRFPDASVDHDAVPQITGSTFRRPRELMVRVR